MRYLELFLFVGSLYLGFLAGCYYVAQLVGPRNLPDGSSTNRWQRVAWLANQWFDHVENKREKQ